LDEITRRAEMSRKHTRNIHHSRRVNQKNFEKWLMAEMVREVLEACKKDTPAPPVNGS
jgi:beta-galactosidase GanA